MLMTRVADWLAGLSFLTISAELVFLMRDRSEFRRCGAVLGFLGVTTLFAALFLTAAFTGIPQAPYFDHLRVIVLAVFCVCTCVWLWGTLVRLLTLPRINELENQVRERTATIQALIDCSPIAIVKVDAQANVEMWNPAAERIFGWKASEILGKPCPTIPENKRAEYHTILSNTLQNRQLPAIVTQKNRKDGSLVDVCMWSAPLRMEGNANKSAVAMIADVTHQRILSGELAKAKVQAEKANLAKSKFLAHVSHEIRTPLTSILGFADLLNSEALTPSQKKSYIEAIVRNGHSLSDLIDDLLDLSKVEAGEMRVFVSPVTVRSLLEDVTSSLELKARSKGIFLKTAISERVPEQVLSDRKRIRQIVVNLAGNAVKFTERGGVKISVDYRRESLLIFVKDTGPGIKHEHIGRLFKPFSQGDSAIYQKFGGTGLGLSLSRELAQLLGGDIELKSTCLGVGSEFLITIPARAVTASSEIEAKALPHRSASLQGRRILVADDAEDNLALISHYLQEAGAEVVTAHDGVDAIDKATRDNFDLVLMDIEMPKMDGVSALRKLLAGNFSTDVIALSAHALDEDRDRYLAQGFADYVTKPIQPSRLVQTLARHMVENVDSEPAPQ